MTNIKEEKRRKREYYYHMFDLKASSLVLGVPGMLFVWVTLLFQMTGDNYGHIELQNNPEKYDIQGVLSENMGYFDQFHMWMPVVAGVLLTLIWLFALVVRYYLPIVKQPKFDAVAHLVLAIILVVATLFLIAYVANVYQATCGENGYVTRKNNEIRAMNNNKTGNDEAKWSEFNCPVAVLLIATSIPSRIHYEKKNWPGQVCFFALPFVVLVFVVLYHGFECIRIYVLAKNHGTIHGESASPTMGKGDDDTLSISSFFSSDSELWTDIE